MEADIKVAFLIHEQFNQLQLQNIWKNNVDTEHIIFVTVFPEQCMITTLLAFGLMKHTATSDGGR